jgi:hypothetical protein
MRSNLLIPLFCGLVIHSLGQSSDDGQQFIKKRCSTEYVTLRLDPNRPPFPPELFHITVQDLRRDTSRIGLVNDRRRDQQEVVFHVPAAKQLDDYLNAGYSSPNGKHDLLVVIKELWISEARRLQNYLTAYDESWHIAFLLEAYLKDSDRYIPLTFFDTAMTASAINSSVMAEHGIPELLSAFMDKIASFDLDYDLAVKKPVTWQQIDSFGRIRYDYPMDTATKLVRGVYANVQEFRNNRPSLTNYELSKDGSGDLGLRIPDADGQMYYTRSVWGLCDGQQRYVMMDGSLFPIFSIQHQYYVFGSTHLSHKSIHVPYILPITGVGVFFGQTSFSDGAERHLRFFRLNEKSGRVTN